MLRFGTGEKKMERRHHTGLLLGWMILIVLAMARPASAQELRVSGVVIDLQTRNPLKGADVYLKTLRVGSTTDEDGFFSIVIAQPALPEDILVISFLGYNTLEIPLNEVAERKEIALSPNAILQDSVIVSAQKIDIVNQEIPHARTVIDQTLIEIRGTNEISSIFKGVPSVQIEGNEVSGKRIQIRGSDPNEVNVYIDGISINKLGVDNAADLSLISLDNIETIEVLKGANLTLLGAGAFGGVVNITSRRSVERELMFKTRHGSFESQQYVGEANLPFGKRVVLNYFGQYSDIRPPIEFLPGEERDPDKSENENVETRRQNHSLNLNYYGERGQLSLRGLAYFLDYQKPLLTNERKNYLGALNYQGSIGFLRDFDFTVNYIYGDDDLIQEVREQPTSFSTNFISQNLTARLLKRVTFGRANEFQFQGEYIHDELTREQFQDNGLGNPISLYDALLYENRLNLAGVIAFNDEIAGHRNLHWNTHIGMRGDFLATGDSYFAPTLGAQIEWKNGYWTMIPYGSYGKNVKFISLKDNSLAGLQGQDSTRIGVIASVADSTLERLPPEISNAGEIGATFQYARPNRPYRALNFSLGLFRNTVFNKLLRHPDRPFLILAQNGRNVTSGIEASAGVSRLAGHFDITASASIFNIDEPLVYPFKPEQSLSLQTDYFSGFGFYLSVTGFYQGKSSGWKVKEAAAAELRITQDDIEEEEIGDYADVDLSVGYRFRLGGAQMNLQFSGNNLFDASGYQFYLLGKRNLQVSLSVRY